MDWSRPVDLYCERTDPSFWAEPLNAVSNAAFLIAAIAAFLQWRRDDCDDLPVLLLILVTAAIGIGSFIFHTFGTAGAKYFDVIPIGIFIYGYLLLALRRFFPLSLLASWAIVIAFAATASFVTLAVPNDLLNGSHAYLPAWCAVLVIGRLTRDTPHGRLLLATALVLAVSLAFRTVDLTVCGALPLGTHFVWHALNGLVLYLMLRAAMAGRKRPA